MRSSSDRAKRFTLVSLLVVGVMLLGNGCPRGLNLDAFVELADAGVDKYLGEFTPISSTDVGDGWTKHTFDPDGGNGPICMAGTPFSAFTRAGNPSRGRTTRSPTTRSSTCRTATDRSSPATTTCSIPPSV